MRQQALPVSIEKLQQFDFKVKKVKLKNKHEYAVLLCQQKFFDDVLKSFCVDSENFVKLKLKAASSAILRSEANCKLKFYSLYYIHNLKWVHYYDRITSKIAFFS